MPSFLFDLNSSKVQINIVVDNQYILDEYTEMSANFENGRTASVHEGQRFGQYRLFFFDSAPAECTLEPVFGHPNAMRLRQFVNDHKACVVMRVSIFRPWIAQSGHQSNRLGHGRLFFRFFFAGGLFTFFSRFETFFGLFFSFFGQFFPMRYRYGDHGEIDLGREFHPFNLDIFDVD